MLEHIKANAEMVVDKLNQHADFQLGYDGPSVEWLEGYILRHRESWDGDMRDKMVSILGSFLGETCAVSYGGEWQHDEEYGWGVAFPGNQQAYPMSKMRKFIEGGAESGDSISSFFSVIPVMLKQGTKPTDP